MKMVKEMIRLNESKSVSPIVLVNTENKEALYDLASEIFSVLGYKDIGNIAQLFEANFLTGDKVLKDFAGEYGEGIVVFSQNKFDMKATLDLLKKGKIINKS
jgi:hypothetical protein